MAAAAAAKASGLSEAAADWRLTILVVLRSIAAAAAPKASLVSELSELSSLLGSKAFLAASKNSLGTIVPGLSGTKSSGPRSPTMEVSPTGGRPPSAKKPSPSEHLIGFALPPFKPFKLRNQIAKIVAASQRLASSEAKAF